jgi:RNA polymerase sigma factor (TIGR02999 family)
MSDVTHILNAIDAGNAKAAEELLPLVYTELRRLAACKMANEAAGHTLQATELVHEAYLRLVGSPDRKWNGRGHFFAAAAEAMRRILIESARRKRAVCHGGGHQRLDIEQVEIAAAIPDDDLLAISEVLEKFAAEDPQKAELVKLRYFAGLTGKEAAEVLHISPATADRWWAYSRAWLYREMEAHQPR